MKSNLKINIHPSKESLDFIEKWLYEEHIAILEKYNIREGFYCEWDSIKESYVNNNLVTLEYQNSAIGFATFQEPFYEDAIYVIEKSFRYRIEAQE